MTATEYEQQAHRTIAGHAAENITYLGFGLMAEAGEVADKIAKAVRRLGFSLEEVMRRNLDKLADRQARGVIVGDGDKR